MAGLVKAIDKKVAENKGRKMSAVLNFTGDATDDYLESIKKFTKTNKIANVAITTTADADRFRVNEDANVTVMHYLRKEVKFNFASNGKLGKKDIKNVVKGTETILQ